MVGGGGGGGGAAVTGGAGFSGAGGGGGSSSGPLGSTFETGVRDGDGVITITFDPEAGGCPPDGGMVAVAVVAAPRFTG